MSKEHKSQARCSC